jgi:hypothetical protein
MKRDKRKFLNLKKKEKGSVTFGDNYMLEYLEKEQSLWETRRIKHKMCY